MSDNEQPELLAVRELETLVRHLGDELSAFRRRALVAEARLKELEAQDGGASHLDLASRVSQLERENERLQQKLAAVSQRARTMLDRVKFLRQQAQVSAAAGGADR
jgi:hypothetical protein